MKWLTAISALQLLGISALQAVGQEECDYETKIVASNGSASDSFGSALALEGDVVVVGAYQAKHDGIETGAVYVFRFDGKNWIEEQELLASDGANDDYFGRAVAINGDHIIVGADYYGGSSSNAGAAYLFQYNGSSWQELAKLEPQDTGSYSYFGRSVGIDGDTIVVSSIKAENEVGWQTGAVYVFRFDEDSITQVQKLLPSDQLTEGYFGEALAIEGDVILAGAYNDSELGSHAGGVYAFRFDGTTWVEEQKILADDGSYNDYFGISVALDGDLALIGAYLDLVASPGTGSVYVFRRAESGWMQEQKLLANDAESTVGFGQEVALAGDLALIGAPQDDDLGFRTGAAYLFQWDRTSWTQAQRLQPSDIAENDDFGSALALVGDSAFVTSPDDDALGSYAGSLYLFSPVPTSDCNLNGYVDDCDVQNGTSLDCQMNGTPDECEADCNGNAIPDDCDLAAGTSVDCQANGVPDECEMVDCNGNGVLDQCDLISKTSLDCQPNGVPDECDDDCNANAVPDICDIDAGTSMDANENQVPDECETECEAFEAQPDDLAEDAYFGKAVAVFKNKVLVGASGFNAAYVMRYTGSDVVVEQKLSPEWISGGDSFGIAVGLDGDWAVVGAYGDDEANGDAGAAYVFAFNGAAWVLSQKLLPENASYGEYFGNAVAIDCDVIAVGAYLDDDYNGLTGDQGSVSVYRYDGMSWVLEQKLFAEDHQPYDSFGDPVDIDGDVIVTGARYDDDMGYNSGSAYVFRYGGTFWTQEQKLLPSVEGSYLHYGDSVAASGDIIVVGAYGESYYEGAVYLYRFDGISWAEEQKLLRYDVGSFGIAVSLDNDFLLIGSGDGSPYYLAGLAFLYQQQDNLWTEVQRFSPPGGAAGNGFGGAVAIYGDSLVIGDEYNDTLGSNSGSAFVYVGIPNTDCNLNGHPDACDIAAGLSLDDNAEGSPDECEPDCYVISKLLADDAAVDDWFGWSVGASAEVVVIGSALDDEAGDHSGAAYVFRRLVSEWSQEQQILGSDTAAGDGFGSAVAISDNTLLIGAPYDDDRGDSTGAAYVFNYDGSIWTERQKLIPDEVDASSYVGFAVAMDGDVAALGSLVDEAAYVFRYNGSLWTQEQVLVPTDYSSFGRAVAISGDVILVGASFDEDQGSIAGAAYLFRFDGRQWVQEQKLLPDDFVNFFGHSVALADDVALIGQWYGYDVYVFRYNGVQWTLEQKLLPGPDDWASEFGSSLAVFDDTALVGTVVSDELSTNAAAYVFRHNGTQWTREETVILPPEGGSDNAFGQSIALFEDSAVLGAHEDDAAGSNSGAAYIVDGVSAADCNGNNISDACDIATGQSSDRDEDSVPDECEIAPCEGDVNGNGIVDPLDSGYVLSRFGCPVGTGDPDCDAADANADGIVDLLDAGYVASRFGKCTK